MIGFKIDVLRPQVDKDVIARNAARAADDIAQSIKNYVKIALTRNHKIATGRTLKSIAAERILDSASRGMFVRHVTGSRSWIYIQQGRRAGGKMPIRRNGNKFEPVPELILWFNALNIPRARWFPILRAIARRGIRPVNIRDRAVRESRVRVSEIAAQTAKRIAAEFFTGQTVRTSVSQSFSR